MENKFDDILREKLENAEIKPPKDLWKKIEARLPKQASPSNKYKYLVAIALFFISSVSSVLIYENYLRGKLFTNNATHEISKTNDNNTLKQTTEPSNKLATNSSDKSSALNTEKLPTQKATTPQNKNKNTIGIQNNSVPTHKKTADASSYNNTKNTLKYVKILAEDANTLQQPNNTTTPNETTENTIKIKESESSLIATNTTPFYNTPFEKFTSATILQSFYTDDILATTDNQIGLSEYEKEKEKQLKNLKEFAGVDVTRGFHAGIFLSIHNNWLTNKNDVKENSNNSIKYKLDFGKSFGLNIGYDFSTRWGVQTEFAYNEQGQRYVETTQRNQTLNKELDLIYLRIPVLAKYKINFINNYNSKPIIVNFIFGPQMNFLLNKRTTINEKNQAFNASHNQTELGLYGGIDFDLFMTKNFYMTFGSRLGFSTAAKKDAQKSFQIGFTTQFNFKKPKKLGK